MTTVEQARKRKRRTFTMEDESYARLTMYAQPAHTNRSRFLEHLLLMGGADSDLGAAPARASPLVAVLDEGAAGRTGAFHLDDRGR